MWIGSYKLQKNVYAPDYVNDQIKEYVESFAKRLKHELPVKYSISLDRSWQSESCYLTIKNNKTKRSFKVSFRNHEGNSPKYDYEFYLSDYRTWNECEKHFLKLLQSFLKPLD